MILKSIPSDVGESVKCRFFALTTVSEYSISGETGAVLGKSSSFLDSVRLTSVLGGATHLWFSLTWNNLFATVLHFFHIISISCTVFLTIAFLCNRPMWYAAGQFHVFITRRFHVFHYHFPIVIVVTADSNKSTWSQKKKWDSVNNSAAIIKIKAAS